MCNTIRYNTIVCQIIPTDKERLTCYFDVISGHHCGLSRSVIHQGQLSEVFAWLELIHLGVRRDVRDISPSRQTTLQVLPLSPRRLFV